MKRRSISSEITASIKIRPMAPMVTGMPKTSKDRPARADSSTLPGKASGRSAAAPAGPPAALRRPCPRMPMKTTQRDQRAQRQLKSDGDGHQPRGNRDRNNAAIQRRAQHGDADPFEQGTSAQPMRSTRRSLLRARTIAARRQSSIPKVTGAMTASEKPIEKSPETSVKLGMTNIQAPTASRSGTGKCQPDIGRFACGRAGREWPPAGSPRETGE